MTKKEIKGRKKGSLATHPWCVEQWCSLSGSKPDPWCCRGAAVFQSPILGIIHVLANMSWWGFRRGWEEQLNRVGGVNGLKEGGKFLAAPRIRGLWAAPLRPSQPKKTNWLDKLNQISVAKCLKVKHLTSLMNWRILLRWSPWTWITSPYSGWSITVPLQANLCWKPKYFGIKILYHAISKILANVYTYPFESLN